jgi:lipopolysaccharide transport system ATP-binding protein
MPENLIHVEAASKKFCRSLKRSLWYGISDLAGSVAGIDSKQTLLREHEFWAVRNVSFALKRGDCLGLIGRNGAGKTTLLRMLNGLIRPDTGRIRMRGSVGAIIALGAGIKDILTGRENIHCMAALRGMNPREAAAKVEEIIEFSGLEEFIDVPMQNYSSGMRTRLSFAVASALDPDILLLDEVLAVGDAAFRDRCYHRIAELRRKSAVIFVSHNMEQVARVCSQVLVMHRGQAVQFGSVEDGIAKYGELNAGSSESSDPFLSIHPPVAAFEARLDKDQVASGGSLSVALEVNCDLPIEHVSLKVVFYNARGAFAADGIIELPANGARLDAGVNKIRVHIDSVPLRNGQYAIAFNLIDEIGDMIVWSYKKHHVTVTDAYVGAMADCQLVLQSEPAARD